MVITSIISVLIIFVGYDQWRRGSEKSCKVSKTLFDLRGNRNWSKKLRRAITKFKQKQNSTEIWANLDENTLTGGSRNCNILDYIQSSRWGTRWRGNHELWGGRSRREIKHYYISTTKAKCQRCTLILEALWLFSLFLIIDKRSTRCGAESIKLRQSIFRASVWS